MTPPVDLSVVVPVFACADSLPELASRVRGACAPSSWELLLVDDASPDDAEEVGRSLVDIDHAVQLLSLDRNRGQQGAVMAGLAWSTGGWVVVLDGDLQDPPEAIPHLLAQARQQGAEAVFAGRRGAYQGVGRRLTSALFRLLRPRVCRVPRDAGLFVALHRDLVDDLVAGCGTHPRVVPMIGLSGRRVVSTPVERAVRARGRSSYSPWRRLRSGVAELAWALRRRAVGRVGRPVDPATWVVRHHGAERAGVTLPKAAAR